MADITYQNVLLLDDNENGLIPYIPPATVSDYGLVKYDGTSITLNESGQLQAISSEVVGRNVGEITLSILPLTDAGLHLLDGALLQYGIYKEFIDYIADLYDNITSSWETYIQPINPSGVTSSSGFSNPSNAFDNNSSTYASCATTTDYIEWNLGETLKVSGFNATIQWVSGLAASCNMAIYSVDDNNNETLIANGSGVAQGASGTSSASFSGIEVNKLRFKCIPNDGGQSPTTSTPSRIVQINIIAQREVKPIFCTESEWQQSVNTYGVCGKFVYDSSNNTVRLPKITGIIEGTTDINALGELVEAGLPNITGWAANDINTGDYGGTVGAFYRGTNGTRAITANTISSNNSLNFDASRSSSLYKNNFNKVQPQTIKGYYYIVIANSTKTDVQVDIDNVLTDLNGKANVSADNFNATGTTYLSGLGMPSNRYIDLTLGASGTTYTAPANGWVCLDVIANSGSYIFLANIKNNPPTPPYTQDAVILMSQYSYTNQQALGGNLPVKKGDNIVFSYNLISMVVRTFKFVYAEGTPSE